MIENGLQDRARLYFIASRQMRDARSLWARRHCLERDCAHQLTHVPPICRAIVNGRAINRYVDPVLIHNTITSHLAPSLPSEKGLLVELGAGYGYVGRTVTEQLKRSYGIFVAPYGVDNYRKDFWGPEERKWKPFISIAEGDLRQIPLGNNIAHGAIMRHVLPFVSEKDHLCVLREISRVMRTGAKLIVQNDGAMTQGMSAIAWTRLISHISMFNGLAGMHYPTAEQLASLGHRVGLQLTHAEDLTEKVLSFLTPETFSDDHTGQRSEGKIKRNRAIFRRYKRMDVDSFEPESMRRDSPRILWPKYSLVFTKI